MKNLHFKESKLLVCASFTFLFGLSLNCAQQTCIAQTDQTAATKDLATPVALGDEVVAKKLQDPSMDFLDALWERKPFILLRIDCSTKAIRDALVKIRARKAAKADLDAKLLVGDTSSGLALPVSDDEFIAKETALILDPVKKFFDDIVEFAERVKPLLRKSLVTPEHPESSILLMQYFSLKEKNLYEFCDRTIVSMDNFDQICHEFIQLFVDLKESLSPKTKAAYVNFLAKIRQNRAEQKAPAAK